MVSDAMCIQGGTTLAYRTVKCWGEILVRFSVPTYLSYWKEQWIFPTDLTPCSSEGPHVCRMLWLDFCYTLYMSHIICYQNIRDRVRWKLELYDLTKKKRWQWLKFEMIYIYVGHRNTFNKWKQAMHIGQWTLKAAKFHFQSR